MSLFWAALVFGCDDPPPANDDPVDPCAGACTGDTACIDGMCVAPDAALAIDAAAPMDAAGAPVNAGPECRAGQRQRCPDEGTCGFAFQPCVEGEWGPCETPAERCDAVDNDCDGEIDEGFEVGTECDEGVGACERPGIMVCGAEGDSVCNASPSEPEDEICNDLDDDCDGTTDEGYDELAAPCTVGVGACARMGQTVCSNDGGTKCSAIAAPSQAEGCDGLDNDCDGTTDEWDPTLGLDCMTDQLGTCARGRHHCVDGALACLADLTPTEEACDGLDNDCDGTADEDGPPLGEACATESLGICALGTVVCDGEGAWACSNVFEPIEETCNGRDDDCDGRLDEDGPQLAQVCDTGLPGECGTGIYACRHGALECDVLFEPTEEICDGRDEDCDGVADENTPAEPRPCRTGQPGDCDNGLIVCEDAAFVCRPAAPPQEERCDGRDNDCDTLADETFPGLGQSCGVGVGECRSEGIIGCSADDLESQCLAAPEAPAAERCDGLDNDCNGVVDDLVEPPSEPDHCGACDVGCDYPNAHGRCIDSVCSMGHCRPGFVDLDGEIANGCEEACLPSTPADEVCDGLDNDCDGVVDGPDCAGELFRFCRERAARGLLDAVCHTFAPDEAASEFWPGSLIAAGDQPPSLFRRVEGEGRRDEGGGYTRRTRRAGPGFELGFHLDYQGSALAIGLFITETPIAPVRDFVDPEEEEEAVPDAGADAGDAGDTGVEDGPVEAFQPGQGYSIWIEPTDTAPEIIIRRSPQNDALWRAQIPARVEGERRFVRVRRARDGAWRVELDGRTIPPDEVAALDTDTQIFDRLSVWLGPSQGRSTAIDSLSMRFDADGDDQYPPQDNCPHVYNPDQVDADQNGRGFACDDRDGDELEDEIDGCPLIPRTQAEAERDTNALCQTAYGLAFLARFSGALQPWVLNLSSGLYQPVDMPTTAATGRLRASRDGWWTWTEDGTVFVQTPEGAVEARGAGYDPDFLGRRLVFLSETRRQVLTQERAVEAEPALLYEMEGDGTLSLIIGPLEQQIVLIRHNGDDIHLLELDLEGNPTMEPQALSPDGDGQAPNVARHPTAQLFALAAVSGVARGISLLDGESGLTASLSLSPTQAAVFTPDGAGLLLLTATPDGGILSSRTLDPEQPATPLLGPSTHLDNALLEPAGVLPLPADGLSDRDSDGHPDRYDTCPDHPGAATVAVRSIDVVGDVNPRILLSRQMDGLALAWVAPDPESVDQSPDDIGRLIRLSSAGDILGRVIVPSGRIFENTPTMTRIPRLFWTGDRYEVFYVWASGWRTRVMHHAPLSNDWVLGDAARLGDWTVANWAVSPTPSGYRARYTQDGDPYTLYQIDFDPQGEVLDSRLLYTNNRSRVTHLRHTTNENVMVLAKGNWSRTVNVDTFTPDGAFIHNTQLSVGETDFEGSHGWSIGFAVGFDGALTGYIDDLQRVHLRIIDQRGAFASLDRIASETLTGATSIWLAHGEHGYGALVEADADEGGTALYFLAVGEDGVPAPHPRRLTPPGVDVLTQRPQLLWDTDAWVAVWTNSRQRIRFARGRFDCQ